MDAVSERLKVIYGDVTLGIQGDGFHYIFSYQYGGPESIVIDGMEWLYRTPKPTFWRATTDNDRGSGFSFHSGMWLGADMFIQCVAVKVYVDGERIKEPIAPENNKYTGNETAERIRIVFVYETNTVPATRVETAYEVLGSGDLEVSVHYHGNKELPQLPVFGMRLIMPTLTAGYKYEGINGETYPDRMAGGAPGIYEIQGLPVTRYLVPQDCNVHMKTKWLEVYRDTVKDNTLKAVGMHGLRFSCGDKEFAFSCLPYTAEELENATHHEELPVPRRTVVSILGAVRGVGGINSWGADVEPAYHIDAGEDIRYSFRISSLK